MLKCTDIYGLLSSDTDLTNICTVYSMKPIKPISGTYLFMSKVSDNIWERTMNNVDVRIARFEITIVAKQTLLPGETTEGTIDAVIEAIGKVLERKCTDLIHNGYRIMDIYGDMQGPIFEENGRYFCSKDFLFVYYKL